MGRFQDLVTQNPCKRLAVERWTSYRRDIARAYAEERRLTFGPPERIADHQLIRFRELLSAAWQAPYWRELIDGFGKPPDRFTLDDLNSFPVLTRDILRAEEDQLRVPGARGAYVNHSGGSTGEPVRFWQDRRYRVHMSVSTRLCNEMAGAFPGARFAKLWGAPRDKRQIEGLAGRAKMWLLNQRYYDAFDMGTERMDRYHENLSRFRPDFIQAYASSAYLLARRLERRGIRPAYPRIGIISSAERLTPEMRDQIERVFPVEVFDRYGSREVSAVAAECEAHEGLHLHEPGYIVETIDGRSGQSVQGEPGEIVITVLNNYAMPFVRYRIGDVGILTNEPCSCGRTTARFKEIIGRTSDNFLMPDGRIVHGECFTHMFYGRPEVAQFQFVQETMESFTLRLAPAAGYCESAGRQIEREIRGVIGERARLRLELVDRIEASASGKRRFTISMLDPIANAAVNRVAGAAPGAEGRS